MKKIVMDASVMVTYLFAKDQEKRKTIKKILQRAETGSLLMISPLMLQAEVANAIRYSETNHLKVLFLYQTFCEMPILYVNPTQEMYRQAIELSLQVNDTVYDALYHVTAQAHDATYLTCDRKYFERAKIYGDIELI